MILEFQGAARVVTGSMHVLRINGSNILLDCGLFQGRRAEAKERNKTFPFDPASFHAVVLSHAHIDHSGNLPNLVKQGFKGPIFCTPATRNLCAIMLADSGHIQEKDAEFLNKKLAMEHQPLVEPLYTLPDVASAMQRFREVPYDKAFDVISNVTATFSDAGHILGSAGVKLNIKENGSTKTLGFTGDIGRWNMPIIRDPAFMGNVDWLISESTYGGRLHDPPENMGKELAVDLRRAIARGGKVIVPAFSVGRTQDLVYELHKLFDAGQLPRIPIYVDSPLAVNATDLFKQHQECFDEETYAHVAQHHDPFGLSQLQYIRSVEQSKLLNELNEPCMIIAASGMCEAGRVLHHLANNVEDPRNMILIVGYQAEHTLGYKLVQHDAEVKIFGKIYKRKAEVVVHNSFSAHADGNELVSYISRFDKKQLQQIFLVHGEPDRQLGLKVDLKHQNDTPVEMPARGQKYTL